MFLCSDYTIQVLFRITLSTSIQTIETMKKQMRLESLFKLNVSNKSLQGRPALQICFYETVDETRFSIVKCLWTSFSFRDLLSRCSEMLKTLYFQNLRCNYLTLCLFFWLDVGAERQPLLSENFFKRVSTDRNEIET